jgi:MFS family permease
MTLMYHEEHAATIDAPVFSVFKDSFIAFFANRRLRATAIVDMATYFTFGAFETFLPVFLSSRNINAYETGIIFAVQVLIIAATKPFFGRLADRVDKRIQIGTGLLLTGISVAAIPFMQAFAGFLVASAVLGLGMSLSTVATSAYVADVAKKEQIGASMGALSSVMDIGHSAGPLATGIIITVAGFTTGFFASFLLAVAVTGIFAVSVRGRAP